MVPTVNSNFATLNSTVLSRLTFLLLPTLYSQKFRMLACKLVETVMTQTSLHSTLLPDWVSVCSSILNLGIPARGVCGVCVAWVCRHTHTYTPTHPTPAIPTKLLSPTEGRTCVVFTSQTMYSKFHSPFFLFISVLPFPLIFTFFFTHGCGNLVLEYCILSFSLIAINT